MSTFEWLIIILFTGMGIGWLWRRASARERSRCPEGGGLYPECLYVLTVNAREIGVRTPENRSTALPFSDLERIVVETNDSGPWGADVWWHWHVASGQSVSYPQGATGEHAALAFARALEGFDDETLRMAMGCTSNETFVVYKRTDSLGNGPPQVIASVRP